MSQENVEIVCRIFDAWASGDWSIGNEYLDQHAVYVISADFPAFGAYFGLDAIRAYWRDFLESGSALRSRRNASKPWVTPFWHTSYSTQRAGQVGSKATFRISCFSPSVGRRSCGRRS